jgi:hypothetical protein
MPHFSFAGTRSGCAMAWTALVVSALILSFLNQSASAQQPDALQLF